MDAEHGEQKISTLETEDRPSVRSVQRMSEGATVVDADGLVVYANHRLAVLLSMLLGAARRFDECARDAPAATGPPLAHRVWGRIAPCHTPATKKDHRSNHRCGQR